jgi:membrane protease YdiL (CAAX protease family)
MSDTLPTPSAPPAAGLAAAAPFFAALAATAATALAIRLVDRAGPTLAGLWTDVVRAAVPGAPASLGPVVAALGATAALTTAYAALRRLDLVDDIRRTPLALGIVGRDVPFLLAGLLFVALYASLADGLARAAGLRLVPPTADPLALLGMILVLPIAEELLLRGALLPGIERRIGAASAIVLSALASLPAVSPVPELVLLALVPQLFFGWMAWSCRSLGAAAVLHATYVFIRLHLAG